MQMEVSFLSVYGIRIIMMLARGVRAIRRFIGTLDPFLDSRRIGELLAKSGYDRESDCSYAIPSVDLSLSPDSGPIRVCGYAFYSNGDDVVIVGETRTLSSAYPLGEETTLETTCGFEDCPSRARVLSSPVARCTIRSAGNREMLAYLQGLISQQPSSPSPAALS